MKRRGNEFGRFTPSVCGVKHSEAEPAEPRQGHGGDARVRSTYTRGVASFANRLVCLAVAVALFGSPAVTVVCLALCLANPLSATSHTGGMLAQHEGHHGAAVPAAVSPHAHHGTVPSPAMDGAAEASTDGRLVGTCDGCCDGALVTLAAAPGVERAGDHALIVAQRVEVDSRSGNVASRAVVPPGPPVPPPSPTRSPLVLRV